MENLKIESAHLTETVEVNNDRVELFPIHINKKRVNKLNSKQLNIMTLIMSSITIIAISQIAEINIFIPILGLPIFNRIFKYILKNGPDKYYSMFYLLCISLMEIITCLSAVFIY